MNTRRRASTQHIPKHYHKLPCLKYISLVSLSLSPLQIQTGHHFLRCDWRCYLFIADLDRYILGHWTGTSSLWHIYGSRSCLFYIHLCEGGAQQIPTGHRSNAIGHSGRSISWLFDGPVFGVLSIYGLLSIDVFVVGMWVFELCTHIMSSISFREGSRRQSWCCGCQWIIHRYTIFGVEFCLTATIRAVLQINVGHKNSQFFCTHKYCCRGWWINKTNAQHIYWAT